MKRVLEVAVCGATAADGFAESMTEKASQFLGNGPHAPSIRIHRAVEPTEEIAAAHHLVVSVGLPPSPWSDISIASTAEAGQLTEHRLVPWVSRWQGGQRAPRAQVALLSEPDPLRCASARRLIGRLRTQTKALRVLRIDHIGSTSVKGLAAKDLIDIQVMVRSDDDALAVAEASTDAAFVHVAGEWCGKDRDGTLHPEQVCVDADPERPVNVNIRSADRPVGRDALLFRDWLRANPDAQARYLAVKRHLVGRQIDSYGEGKEPFISAALRAADTWATDTGWSPWGRA